MTDRLSERDYLCAEKFAESIMPDKLELAVSALLQIPYFSRQMRACGLNPELEEHCGLAKDSLEKKIKAAGNEMILRPDEGIVNYGLKETFRDFYYQKCKDVRNSLLGLLRKYTPLRKIGLEPFSTNIQLGSYNIYFKCGNNKFYILSTNNEECKPLSAIKVKRTLFMGSEIIYASKAGIVSREYYQSYSKSYYCNTCGGRCKGHLYNQQFGDFDDKVDSAYKFYFANLKNAHLAKSFTDYLKNLFFNIPSKVENELEGRVSMLKSVQDAAMLKLIGPEAK